MKRINLALQGGGAHGAFTWGVLDRILEEEDVEIAGISGTSAGALNGAALKAGMMRGGRAGARENLDWLWAQVGARETGGPTGGLAGWMSGGWMSGAGMAPLTRAIAHSPAASLAETWARMVSPYSSGPFYANPLRPIVERFDFARVCARGGPRFFVGATCVRTGKIRIFEGEEIGTEAILASACLPTLFRAIGIDDPETGRREYYWDGGYTGNPALFPLFDTGLPEDIVIVNINPLERAGLPVTASQIQNRINEISFNSSLLRELRAIAFVQRLLDEGRLAQGEKRRVLVHMIADDGLMNELSVATKLLPNPLVLARLKAAGRAAAARFLEAHKDDLGRRGTVDLEAAYG